MKAVREGSSHVARGQVLQAPEARDGGCEPGFTWLRALVWWPVMGLQQRHSRNQATSADNATCFVSSSKMQWNQGKIL